MRVRQEDCQKLAFVTQNGLFEPKVMPFGFVNAPAQFQRMITSVLREYIINKFLVVYIDDILIFSNGVEEHKHHVSLILQRLRGAKLYGKSTNQMRLVGSRPNAIGSAVR
jgi:hypothetical protein